MTSRKLLITTLLIPAAIVLSFVMLPEDDAKKFHSPEEIMALEKLMRTPIQEGEYFLGASNCKGCHGFDTLKNANIDGNGVDINLFDDWESSMMANSAIDPLWRAKVSHEILVNPAHAIELQTKCTSCHAPMGHYTAMYHGAAQYTMDDLKNDTLGTDGVSCTGCHTIGTENLGKLFSGAISYDTTKKEFGPFKNPVTGPMQLYVGLIPTYSEHMSTSQVCAPCHTLITHTTDLNGNYTGGTFVEQATYHEWLNSALAEDNIVCQRCHMPQVKDSVVIANNILSLPPRAPFNQHQFAGGNYFMVNLIKQNKNVLGAHASDANFDSTLAATYRMLTQQSLKSKIFLDSIENDTVYLRYQLTNLAGHKFPSGYPSRRAVVQIVVLKSNGDTLFHSGVFDDDFEVKNINIPFEKHHTVITGQTQTQIYEMIMGDVNGNVTTVLERAAVVLKDNRLPPEGFTTDFVSYDTIAIVGDAVNDPDFNTTGFTEGSGRDVVHFHIPLSGQIGSLNVYAKVFYQPVPPGWLKELFSYSSEDIDVFKSMYDAADKNPVIVTKDSLLNIALPTLQNATSGNVLLHILSTLTSDYAYLINSTQLMIYEAELFNSQGKEVGRKIINSNAGRVGVLLPNQSGIYYLKVKTDHGDMVFKILRQ